MIKMTVAAALFCVITTDSSGTSTNYDARGKVGKRMKERIDRHKDGSIKAKGHTKDGGRVLGVGQARW